MSRAPLRPRPAAPGALLAGLLLVFGTAPAAAHGEGEGKQPHEHSDEQDASPEAPVQHTVEQDPGASAPAAPPGAAAVPTIGEPAPAEGGAPASPTGDTQASTASSGGAVGAADSDADEGGWEPHTLADSTWRQSARRGDHAGDSAWFEPTHFAVELRFGPYFPEVDEEFGGSGPYEQMFGNDARFYFGLELDWLPLHIPYVASLGPAFGWGITGASGPAIVESTGAEAGSDTSLTIHPMHLSAVVRIDGPLRRYRVPIVPYVKVGLGMGLWMASGPSGTSEVGGVTGEGTSYGLHTALGAALALNAFDPSAAVSLREDTGIRYAYLWGEWMKNNLDGIGSSAQMHVGTSTFVLGLALDF